MKLMIATVRDRDYNRVNNALLAENVTFTRLASTGGVVSRGSSTLLIGTGPGETYRVLEILCSATRKSRRAKVSPEELNWLDGAELLKPVKVRSGKSVAFVISVDHFHRC